MYPIYDSQGCVVVKELDKKIKMMKKKIQIIYEFIFSATVL